MSITEPTRLDPGQSDRWTEAATYERFMGRWSRALAPEFLRWLEPARGLDWLDLGCGTGALTAAICAEAAPASVVACDPAEPFIEYARSHSTDPRVSYLVADAASFPVPGRGYDAIGSLLALNFFPDPGAALASMAASTTPGGTVSACVWDYAEGMQFLRYFWDAALELQPSARARTEAVRFPLCNADALGTLWRGAGLGDVKCGPIEIATEFADFDDYWQPLLGGTGPAPTFVTGLRDADRERLRRNLQAVLPADAAGRISLSARAWAVRGVRT